MQQNDQYAQDCTPAAGGPCFTYANDLPQINLKIDQNKQVKAQELTMQKTKIIQRGINYNQIQLIFKN